MILFESIAASFAIMGLAQGTGGWLAVQQFRRRAALEAKPAAQRPPVTLLKPLHGDEPLLEEALASFCAQDYPEFQIVFGVQSADDAALPVVARLRERFPDLDLSVVVDSTVHGTNRKIGNLINMYPRARHDVLVISDSDLHVTPDYLDRIVTALEVPGTGVVTTLYSGLPSQAGLSPSLGSMQISQVFLPGALLARGLGRRDCLGATMALRRKTLEGIGGLQALASHLADDNMLGRLVAERGMGGVTLATTVPATTVPESDLAALFRHELRWARTIQSLAPVGFALSIIQYPLFWAILAVLFSGGENWALTLLGGAWMARAIMTRGIDRALGLSCLTPVWLLPVRDLMSVTVLLASYRSDEVQWRGQVIRVDRPNYTPRSYATPDRLVAEPPAG
jgi:ceramide glucosyltransferase